MEAWLSGGERGVDLFCHCSSPPATLGLMPPPSAIASVATIPATSLSLAALQTSTVASGSGRPTPAVLAASVMASVQGALGNAASQAVRLSSTFSPLPAKLVTKIQAGQFIEMKELLVDNIALQRQLDAIQAQPAYQLPAAARPRMRDIDSPLTWAYCFLAYAAIRTTDASIRNLLTYGRLIIRESQRHGGVGWLEYDKVFRQQAALDGSLPWNELSPSLFASTILSARAGPSSFCTLCQEADHQASQCALAFFQAPSGYRPTRQELWAPSAVWQQPPPPPSTQPPPLPATQPASRRVMRPETLERICVSWNKGRCVFPGSCQFHHVCATCRTRGHRAKDCAKTPESSLYKARGGGRPSTPDGSAPKAAP